jgi:prevent-host-death family protein
MACELHHIPAKWRELQLAASASANDSTSRTQKGAIHKRDAPMLDITKDIQSLTTFRRRSGDFMKQLKKTKRPVVLTVKGKAQAIVQDAEAYQRLLDIAALADPREGIRQGLEYSRQGLVRDAEEFFAEFEAAHGISS